MLKTLFTDNSSITPPFVSSLKTWEAAAPNNRLFGRFHSTIREAERVHWPDDESHNNHFNSRIDLKSVKKKNWISNFITKAESIRIFSAPSKFIDLTGNLQHL